MCLEHQYVCYAAMLLCRSSYGQQSIMCKHTVHVCSMYANVQCQLYMQRRVRACEHVRDIYNFGAVSLVNLYETARYT